MPGIPADRGLDDLSSLLRRGFRRQAIGSGQAQVRHNHVEGKPVERFERRLAVGGLADLKAFVRKSFSHNTSQRFLIIDQEEVWHGSSKY